MKFESDENKNQINIRKHGIDFHDAAYVFSRSQAGAWEREIPPRGAWE